MQAPLACMCTKVLDVLATVFKNSSRFWYHPKAVGELFIHVSAIRGHLELIIPCQSEVYIVFEHYYR